MGRAAALLYGKSAARYSCKDGGTVGHRCATSAILL